TKRGSIWIRDRTAAGMFVGQRYIFKLRQMRAFVYARNGLKQAASEVIVFLGGPVGSIGNNTGKFGITVDLCQLLVRKGRLALAIFDSTVAEHQMGEIEIKFVRGNIGTFDHETHVAEGAGIDDFLHVVSAQVIDLFIGT